MLSLLFCFNKVCIYKYKTNASHVTPCVSASRHKLIHLHLHLRLLNLNQDTDLLEIPELCFLECKTI